MNSSWKFWDIIIFWLFYKNWGLLAVNHKFLHIFQCYFNHDSHSYAFTYMPRTFFKSNLLFETFCLFSCLKRRQALARNPPFAPPQSTSICRALRGLSPCLPSENPQNFCKYILENSRSFCTILQTNEFRRKTSNLNLSSKEAISSFCEQVFWTQANQPYVLHIEKSPFLLILCFNGSNLPIDAGAKSA